MTVTFENENDVIIYAPEKIICYARENQYISVAQSVWWITSVIGLTDGLVTHIDNLRKRSMASQALLEITQLSSEQELAPALPNHHNIGTEGSCVHPDRISQIDNTVDDCSKVESDDHELDRATLIINNGKEFLCTSRKERKAFKQKPGVLSRTRSGQIPVKPLTKKQRKRLRAIPKDTLVAFLENSE